MNEMEGRRSVSAFLEDLREIALGGFPVLWHYTGALPSRRHGLKSRVWSSK
jgi:hypothetical protein